MFCLNLVADAEAIDYPSPSFVYACEDVNNYYANADHLEGKSFKKKLNSIIARHQSLSYREVFSIHYCNCSVAPNSTTNMCLKFSVWFGVSFKKPDLMVYGNRCGMPSSFLMLRMLTTPKLRQECMCLSKLNTAFGSSICIIAFTL